MAGYEIYAIHISMKNTAFAYYGAKEAALYFDYVVPLFLIMDAARESEFDELISMERSKFLSIMLSNRNHFVKLLPKELSEGTIGFDKFVQFNLDILKSIGLFGEFSDRYDENTKIINIIKDNIDELNFIVDKFVLETSIPNALYTTSHFVTSDSGFENGDIAVTLSGLHLVDIDKTPIEHLIEFREDAESVAALRQLRLFAQNNYMGKSKSFIEDDLLHRIHKYDEAAKKWKFGVIQTGLATLFNSKTALGTLGGTVAAALTGSPVTAASAAILGTMLEIGKVSLAISKKKFEGRTALSDNPVSYLVHARDNLIR